MSISFKGIFQNSYKYYLVSKFIFCFLHFEYFAHFANIWQIICKYFPNIFQGHLNPRGSGHASAPPRSCYAQHLHFDVNHDDDDVNDFDINDENHDYNINGDLVWVAQHLHFDVNHDDDDDRYCGDNNDDADDDDDVNETTMMVMVTLILMMKTMIATTMMTWHGQP